MRLGVIGGGAWGTALAQVAASGGDEVMLWAREPEVVSSVNETRENRLFLPGVPLSEGIVATGDAGGAGGLRGLPGGDSGPAYARGAGVAAGPRPAADPLLEGDRGGERADDA